MMDTPDCRNSRILIVDDEPRNVALMARVLKNDGFQNIQGTSDPVNGCELYQKFRPNLVLLDLKMPQMDGFQVMSKLHEIAKDNALHVMVITALRDEDTCRKALKAGAEDVLAKPFIIDDFLARIHKMLELHLEADAEDEALFSIVDQVHSLSDTLDRTHLEFFQCLGRTAEFHDEETGYHVVRLSYYSAILGRAAGLSADDCHLLLRASPMHDIGKIAIPDHILFKPEKLDAYEWEIMKSHTVKGAEILSGDESDLIQMARQIALEHHEKWDGSGYPHGVKGEDISLAARIVAICDVFDALTTERCYKKAWTVAQAVQEIESQSGLHFDPWLVEKFKEILPKIIEIKEKFRD